MSKRFLSIAILILIGLGMYVVPVQAAHIQAKDPDMLTVISSRAAGPALQIKQVALVKKLYHHILTLPKVSPHQVCPDYIASQFGLSFTATSQPAPLLQAKVVEGGCMTVTILPRHDVRVADPAFWTLLQQAKALPKDAAFPQGLSPGDLQSAYNLPSASDGNNQTIGIIDAYNNPNAEHDLTLYRAMYHLAPCTSTNKCFAKVSQNGDKRYPQNSQSWSGEIALDLDMASAICPSCHILLVEARSTSFNDLGTSVNTAVRLGANVISNSYGGLEDPQSAQAIAHYYNHPGVIITASSGDSGYGVQLPAALNTVIAVGGTSLLRDSNTTRGWSEMAWSGSGSGCSQYVNKPSWQQDNGCRNRTVADVSAVADPDTGVAVYNNGWAVYGGTSASSPIIAGVFALAGNAAEVNASQLYNVSDQLNDVLIGSNGHCNGAPYLCNAGEGYDGPTGLGTPNSTGAF